MEQHEAAVVLLRGGVEVARLRAPYIAEDGDAVFSTVTFHALTKNWDQLGVDLAGRVLISQEPPTLEGSEWPVTPAHPCIANGGDLDVHGLRVRLTPPAPLPVS